MRSPLLYLGALLVIALCTAAVGPYFVDWSQYRAEVEAYAQRIVGRPVTIVGDVSLRLLPSPRIQLSDVRVANPADTTSERFMQARSVDIQVALTPLLKGRVEIESVRFDHAVFELEHLGSGTGNWTFAPEEPAAALVSAENVAIRSAEIRNSTIYLRDGTRGGLAELTDVNLQLSAQSLEGPYSVAGTVRHEDVPVDVSINTGRRVASGEMRLSVRLVQDGGRGPTYAFDGVHRNGGEEPPGIDGRLTVSRAVLDEANAWLGGGQEDALPYAFRANVRGTLSAFNFEEISLLLDQRDAATEIKGALEVMIGETLELTARFGAGHLDLDRLMQQTGLAVEDLVPDLAHIDALPQLFAGLPPELDAVLQVEIGALTLSGETIEGARLEASYAEQVLSIDSLSGRVPGRGRLQIERARYDAGQDNPAFRGAFELDTRDTRGFARWVAPQLTDWLEAAPRALRGVSTLSGELVVDGRSIELADARLEHGATVVEGRVAYDPGERPRLDAALDVSFLDLDPFTADAAGDTAVAGGADLEALRRVAGSFLEETAPRLAGAYDGMLDLTVHELRWRRMRGGPLTVRGEMHGGTVDVAELAVDDFHGMDLSGSARLAWTGAHPDGGVRVEFASDRPERLLDLVVWPQDHAIDGAGLRAALRRAAPARVAVGLSMGGDGESSGLELNATLAGVDLTASGAVLGSLDDLRTARLDIAGMALAESNDALLALLGRPHASGETPGVRRELAAFSLEGVLGEGAVTALELNLYDSKARAEGVTRWADGAAVTRARISLESADSRRFFDAFGLDAFDDATTAQPLKLEGSVGTVGRRITVHGLGGAVGDNSVGFSGTIDLSDGIDRVVGTATLSSVSLPWLVQRALGTRRSISELLASGAFDTLAAWSSLPFNDTAFADLAFDLGFEVGELMLNPQTAVEGVEGHLVYEADRLDIEALKGRLYGGRLALDATLVNRDGEVSMDATYELNGAAAGRAMADRTGEPLLDGEMSLAGTLTAAGRSPLGLVSSMAGDGLLQLRSAVLKGVDPRTFTTALQEVATPEALENTLTEVLTRGAMAMGNVASSYTVKNGVVRFTPVLFGGDAASGHVQGRIDVAAWLMDTRWTLRLSEYPDAPEFAMMHAGDLAAVERAYDLSGLRSYLVVRGLTEGVARLEEIQRREAEEIARIEEMERRVREEAERRARERAEQIERQDAARRAREEEISGTGGENAGTQEAVGEVPETVASNPPEPAPAEEPEASEPEAPQSVEEASIEPEAPQEPGEATADAGPSEADRAPELEPEVLVIEIPNANGGDEGDGGDPTELTPERPESQDTTAALPAPAAPPAPAQAPEPESEPQRERRDDRGPSQGGLFSDDPTDWIR